MPKERAGHGQLKAAIKSMKIGDSFLYPYASHLSPGAAARKLGMKVTGRKISKTQIRFWRVK